MLEMLARDFARAREDFWAHVRTVQVTVRAPSLGDDGAEMELRAPGGYRTRESGRFARWGPVAVAAEGEPADVSGPADDEVFWQRREAVLALRLMLYTALLWTWSSSHKLRRTLAPGLLAGTWRASMDHADAVLFGETRRFLNAVRLDREPAWTADELALAVLRGVRAVVCRGAREVRRRNAQRLTQDMSDETGGTSDADRAAVARWRALTRPVL